MSLSYNPSQFTKGARATFFEDVAQMPATWVDRVCTVVPSEWDDEDYAWIGEAAQMEEFKGEQTFSPMSDTLFTIANKLYTSGIEVKRVDFADDKVGGIRGRIRQLAEVAALHPNKLISDALINGTSATLGACYDGGAFFTATHPARGYQTTTQSNLLTGTGTSTAQAAADIAAAVNALISMLGENNEPINETAQRFVIIHPISGGALSKAIREAVNSSVVAQTTNVQLRDYTFDIIPNPRLNSTSAVDYYVGIMDTSCRGLVFQDREPLTFEAQDNAEADAAFTREVYRYKARRRCRVGYAKWQRLVKVDN